MSQKGRVICVWLLARPAIPEFVKSAGDGKANAMTRGRPNFGFGFGSGAECGQTGTFGGHSVSAESSCTAFGALSVSVCCSW